MTVQSQLRGV